MGTHNCQGAQVSPSQAEYIVEKNVYGEPWIKKMLPCGNYIMATLSGEPLGFSTASRSKMLISLNKKIVKQMRAGYKLQEDQKTTSQVLAEQRAQLINSCLGTIIPYVLRSNK